MKLNPKYVQLVGDALIPLLGFFLWSWSLYFILLFYFLDLFSSEVIVHLKSKKTVAFQGASGLKTLWFKWGTVSLVSLSLGVIMIHFAMYFIAPGIDFWKEAVDFWNYEEMGIKQGYILFPLVFFVSYQQYRMMFLMSGRFRNNQIVLMWKKHIAPLLLVIAFAGICVGISWFFTLPEVFYVIGIIAVTILYKLRYS